MVKSVEYASEVDRVWFERHPGVSEYARPYIDGEFPDMPEFSNSRPNVRVTQLRKGIRQRRLASRGFCFLDTDTGVWNWEDEVPE